MIGERFTTEDQTIIVGMSSFWTSAILPGSILNFKETNIVHFESSDESFRDAFALVFVFVFAHVHMNEYEYNSSLFD